MFVMALVFANKIEIWLSIYNDILALIIAWGFDLGIYYIFIHGNKTKKTWKVWGIKTIYLSPRGRGSLVVHLIWSHML